ncbi:hypothetical protein [Alteromonas gracilis]|uniref:Integrase n=1 Tax=Alteromonas gracilis TaxID=1479524 RepID=A0ABX5CTZ8_9ALTE|nr:hypothetical protein [Alteromonas gracilis]PRO70131.1 hypothetical protein C6Y39_04525 [Alteromonas gracilis]
MSDIYLKVVKQTVNLGSLPYYLHTAFGNAKQRGFIDLILDKYAEDGVRELAATKMRSLIELKYLYGIRCRVTFVKP